MLGAAGLILASCVSQDPALGLSGHSQVTQDTSQLSVDSVASDSSGDDVTEGATSQDTVQATIVTDSNGEALGVPVKAPREIASAAPSQSQARPDNQAATNTLAIVSPTDNNPSQALLNAQPAQPANEAQTRISESFQPSSSGDDAVQDETELAALSTDSDAAASAEAQLATQSAPAAKPRVAKRARRAGRMADESGIVRNRRKKTSRSSGGLFAALGNTDKPEIAVRSRTAGNASRASLAAGNGGLPGVKSNAELFGINESEQDDDELRATQVAAVGSFGRLSPNGLRVQHDKVEVSCLKPGVLKILKIVERRYGSKPIITSGYRSPKRNRRAGGARNSQHIFCKAADIQVEGVSKWDLAKYLRSIPGRGGVGTYCRTKSVHFDIGSKRDWHHPCRRSSVRKRKKT